jgi:hypothetical protein
VIWVTGRQGPRTHRQRGEASEQRSTASRKRMARGPGRSPGIQGEPRPSRAPAAPRKGLTEQCSKCGVERPVMILPQVHLRKPCYDFSFL